MVNSSLLLKSESSKSGFSNPSSSSSKFSKLNVGSTVGAVPVAALFRRLAAPVQIMCDQKKNSRFYNRFYNRHNQPDKISQRVVKPSITWYCFL